MQSAPSPTWPIGSSRPVRGSVDLMGLVLVALAVPDR